MDLLFKRYASPFLLIEEMIRMGQLSEFVSKVISKNNEDIQWEFWLHKVYDKSFEEYQEASKQNDTQSLAMTDEQVDAEKNRARGILNNFKPK